MAATAEKNTEKPKFEVEINEELCKGNLGKDKCELCMLYCKPQALEIDFTRINSRSFHPIKHAHPELCTGCGNCYLFCPHGGIKAIRRIRT